MEKALEGRHKPEEVKSEAFKAIATTGIAKEVLHSMGKVITVQLQLSELTFKDVKMNKYYYMSS